MLGELNFKMLISRFVILKHLEQNTHLLFKILYVDI